MSSLSDVEARTNLAFEELKKLEAQVAKLTTPSSVLSSSLGTTSKRSVFPSRLAGDYGNDETPVLSMLTAAFAPKLRVRFSKKNKHSGKPILMLYPQKCVPNPSPSCENQTREGENVI